MTSKISCIKLIKENIRHRAWLAALTAVAFVLMMPVYTVLYLNSLDRSVYEQNSAPSEIDYFPMLFNCSRLAIFVAVLAILVLLCALTGFWHIHSREKLDFYHSLPVRRERLYASCYLSGLIMLYVPYLICAALTAAAGAASGFIPVTPHMAALCLQSVFGGILAVFVIYNACVFAIVLTGRTVTALLSCLAVSVYPLIVLYSINLLQADFFHTFYTTGPSLADKFGSYVSPAGLFVSLLHESSMETFSPAIVTAAILISIILLTASFLMYRIYPSEAAGTTIVFSLSAPILKVLISIPCSVFTAMLILDFMWVPAESAAILLSVLTAVILCAVIEFIFHMDLRKLLRGWKSSLVSIAGVAAVICIFQFDLTGYDTYIPKEDSVKAVAVYPDSFSSYFSYPGYESQMTAELESYVPSDQTDTVYALAQSGITNLKKGIAPDSIYDTASTHTDNEYLNTVFHYKLNNGRTVSRQYALLRNDVKKALTEFLMDEDYRRQTFPVTQIDKSRITGISIVDLYGTEELLNLNPKQRESLLAAYETDLMNASPDTLINGTETAQLQIYIPDPYTADTVNDFGLVSYDMIGNYCMDGLYIYPEYTNTLNFLESCGYTLRTDIDPSEIAELNMTVFTDSFSWKNFEKLWPELSGISVVEEYDGQISAEVRLEEDIALILDNLRQKHFGMLEDSNTSGGYVDIYYKNGEFGFLQLE